jgi:hypothetical protein
MGKCSSGESFWEGTVSIVEGGGEEASSPKGNAVSSAALDLGDKSVAAKLAYQAADASTPATYFVGIGRW